MFPRTTGNERYRIDPEYRAYMIAGAKRRYQLKRQEIAEYQRQWARKKRAEAPLFRAKLAMRERVGRSLRARGWPKDSSTFVILGADFETVRNWIERQFTTGMSWDNYGEWELDHAIPLSSAQSIDELRKLFHYSNLQPLWASDNASKGKRIGWFPVPGKTGRLF